MPYMWLASIHLADEKLCSYTAPVVNDFFAEAPFGRFGLIALLHCISSVNGTVRKFLLAPWTQRPAYVVPSSGGTESPDFDPAF